MRKKERGRSIGEPTYLGKGSLKTNSYPYWSVLYPPHLISEHTASLGSSRQPQGKRTWGRRTLRMTGSGSLGTHLSPGTRSSMGTPVN